MLILAISCQNQKSGTEVLAKEYPLMSYEELAELEIDLPFVYESSGGDKFVKVFGSYHTNDPEDSIMSNIEQAILDFRPDLILYEGDGIGLEENKEENIAYYFEMGLVRHLADSLGVEDANLEPPIKKRYDYLLKKYPKQEVFLALVGTQITLLLVSNEGGDGDFEAFYKQFIKTLKGEGFPIDKEREVGYFYKVYQEFYGKSFSLVTFDYKTVEVKYNKTQLNIIMQDLAHYRDNYMLSLIEGKLEQYHRIYIQIGGRHAIVWQRAVRKMLERQKH